MIIGIGGISTGGKTWIAQKIIERLRNQKTVNTLCQDNYTLTKEEIPMIRDHIDWEIPESMNFDKFYKTIVKNSRKYDVVVAEGLFVFHQERLVNLYDKMLYLTLEKENFLKRKKKDLRWGKEPEWYMEHIWESHLLYRKDTDNLDNLLVVKGEFPVDLERIFTYLGF